MDAEKFDKVVLDLLYDELDELTRASAIRHTEQSGRAKALYAELRATREVGALPLVAPPSDLEARILAAEERAHAERPLRQRFGALVSIAASYAMRPELVMAAVLLLMVGSSLLLMRVKPGAPSSVQITERGVAESEHDPASIPAARPEAPAAEAPAPADAPRARAKGEVARAEPATPAPEEKIAQAERRPSAAQPVDRDSLYGRDSDGVGSLGGSAGPAAPGAGAGFAPPPPPVAAHAKAAGARDDEASSAGNATANAGGCESAVSHYESVIANPSSPEAADAARFAAADCYARLGRTSSARRAYTALLSVPAYADRARQALAELPPSPPAAATKAAPAKPSP